MCSLAKGQRAAAERTARAKALVRGSQRAEGTVTSLEWQPHRTGGLSEAGRVQGRVYRAWWVS